MDATKCLPPELLEKILKYLSLSDLARLSEVNQNWREATNRDQVWLVNILCLKNSNGIDTLKVITYLYNTV